MASHGPTNIFSFNSSRNVKAVTKAKSYEDDSNCEKDSTASFDFNLAATNRSVVGPFTMPTPSKWDDAEKWLSAGEAAPAKPSLKNSPLSAPSQTGAPTLCAQKGDVSNCVLREWN
uniref:Uncharacterized protein n=1 Tax=Physcomitrium patens TaxID=3218 RepID=A9RJN8_PHYPA|nr:hypothetical protein PHYPA_006384 [Physcomitrium patens]